MAELRPFTIQDESARYWSRRLSWLSSLIGYGLIVAVPIISNQVNVQIGALAKRHHYAVHDGLGVVPDLS
ncbi:membrane protein YbiO [Escherichia coli]|uniref:Membrane protein YbiO n=1 Tax=Escherichia coli TaxID=562 RepID=A0A376MTY2_ECOLX|nr:membrane protein YbiO [Escherichia coli]